MYERDLNPKRLLNNMKEVEEEIEGIKLKNLTINDLLNKEFLEKIKKLNLNSISLILVYEEKDKDKQIVLPISINHQNSEEVKNKIIHLQSPNQELLTKLSEAIKKD